MHPERTSKAIRGFESNCKDVERLLEIHVDLTGTAPGRRYGVEVLNKSAIVLICAHWEAYNEDLCDEAVEHLCKRVKNPEKLPLELRKTIAARLKEDKHELAAWKLAGVGWKEVLKSNLQHLQQELTAGLNTPKSAHLQGLYEKSLGIKDITDAWKCRGLTRDNARRKIDKFVTLRGSIAHRGGATSPVTKDHCNDFLKLVRGIVSRVDAHVKKHVQSVAPTSLARRLRITRRRKVSG